MNKPIAPLPPKPHPPHRSRMSATPRRSFLFRSGVVVIGAILAVFPFLTGLVVFLDPLRKHAGQGKWYPVGTLDGLQPGVPQRLAVVGDRHDAWSYYADEPIGAVYLIIEPDKTVRALNVTCPHAGCSVGYEADKQCFLCPCHTSAFDLEGKPISAVPPRGMDSLDCQVRSGGEIWVKYQDFRTGGHEKIAKA